MSHRTKHYQRTRTEKRRKALAPPRVPTGWLPWPRPLTATIAVSFTHVNVVYLVSLSSVFCGGKAVGERWLSDQYASSCHACWSPRVSGCVCVVSCQGVEVAGFLAAGRGAHAPFHQHHIGKSQCLVIWKLNFLCFTTRTLYAAMPTYGGCFVFFSTIFYLLYLFVLFK